MEPLKKEVKMISFDDNFYPQLEGYISEVEDGVYISAIKAKEIGAGYFSKLVKELKSKYKWIKIPTPSTMMMIRAEHLGFVVKEEYFGEPFNEMGTIMFWSKE